MRRTGVCASGRRDGAEGGGTCMVAAMAAYRWAAGPAGVLGMNMQERAGPRGGEEGGKGKRIEKEVRPETAGDSGGKTTVAQYQLVGTYLAT